MDPGGPHRCGRGPAPGHCYGIGSVLEVARTAEDLAEVAVPIVADLVVVDLLPAVEDGGEPETATSQLRAQIHAACGTRFDRATCIVAE